MEINCKLNLLSKNTHTNKQKSQIYNKWNNKNMIIKMNNPSLVHACKILYIYNYIYNYNFYLI